MHELRQVTEAMLRVKGFIAAPFTPLAPSGTIQLDRIADYAQHLEEHRVSNVFVGGTSSEFSSFTVSERKEINAEWIKQGRAYLSGHVIVHVGASALGDVQELARNAAQNGAHAIACVAPFYQVPRTVEVMVDYFKAVAEAVPETPLFYYHIPMFTHCPVDLTAFLRAASTEIPTMVGLKYTDSNMKILKALHDELGQRFQLLNGFDQHYFDAVQMGLETAVHACFSFAPGPFHRMREAVARGDSETAAKEQTRVLAMTDMAGRNAENGIIAGLKDMAAAAGLDLGPSRMPLRSGGEKRQKALTEELRAMDFFEWRY